MPYSRGDVTVSEPVSYQARMPVPSPSITRRTFSSPSSYTSRYSSYRTASVERPYHATSSSYTSSASSYLSSRPPRPAVDYKSSSAYTTEYRSRYSSKADTPTARTSPSRSSYSRQTSVKSDSNTDSSRSESKDSGRFSRERSESRESSSYRSRDSSVSSSYGTLGRQRSSSRDYSTGRASTDIANKYNSTDSPRLRSYLNDLSTTSSYRTRTVGRLGSSLDSNTGSTTRARGIGGSSYISDYKRSNEVTIVNGDCSSRPVATNINNEPDNSEDDDNGNRPSVAEIRRQFDGNRNLQNGRGSFQRGSTPTAAPKPASPESPSDSEEEEEASSSSTSSGSEERAPGSLMDARRTPLNPSTSQSPGQDGGASPRRYRPISTTSPQNSSSRFRPSSQINGDLDDQVDNNVNSASPRLPRQITKNSAAERGGLVGLRNIGNTCFMNSVIQCLSNTKPLLEHVLGENYLSEINTTMSGMKGALIKAFSTVIQELWRPDGDERVVNTTALKSQIQRFAPRFMGYSQQDAQEFLRYLLEGLHEDVNRITTKPRPITTDVDEHLSDNHKAIESWKRYLRFDDSKIVDIFVGQLKSTLQCTVCGHCSVTFDPFWDLSLPIPSRTGQVRLQQCFDLFTKEEVLDGDEKPTCSKCQVRRKCTKSFSIQKFPKILVLHLKRFSPMERFRGKLNCTVDFPLNALDLNAYAANKGQGCIYNLYGVANHSGTTYSGHYTAYCKHPYTGDWHEYNDSRVSTISHRNIVTNEGYVLFYELVGHSSHL